MSNELEATKTKVAVVDDSEFSNWLDTARFEHIWRMAKVFSETSMVPSVFQKKPADCMVAIQMALRCGIDPMMFLQNSYVISGKPSIETKLAIAMLLKFVGSENVAMRDDTAASSRSSREARAVVYP